MVLVGHTEDMELVFNETFNQLAHQGDDGCFFLCCACRQIAVRALTYLHAADIVQRDAHGLGVLGGQSSRIYFDVAVAEVANVEVFAHLRHRFLLVAKGSVSLLKEHCPRFWNTAKPPITDRVLHDPELQGQRVDATFGFYGFVENVHALSVSRS